MCEIQLISLIIVVEMIITITSAASVADLTNLVLFNGPTISDSRAYAYNRWDLLTLDPAFDPCRPTAFYVHGYNQNTSAPAFQTLVKAYNIRGSHNLVAYDWSKAANGNYITSALPNVVTLGNTMGGIILTAIKNGMAVEKFHAIGHSLGAHLCGYLARQVISASGGAVKLHRVTGLDPAYPGFYPPILYQYLSSSDAIFVDNIHTDAGNYGGPSATGTVDFWPNSGARTQPGCPTGSFAQFTQEDVCSHERSTRLFADSVQYPGSIFLAISSASWNDFVAGNVNASNTAIMGIDCFANGVGSYYLRTGLASPFASGISGISVN